MKAAFLSSSVSRRGGGVTEVKRRLAQCLLQIPSMEVEVFGLQDDQTNLDLPLWKPLVPQVFQASGPAAIGYAPTLLQALKRSDAQVAHLHGLWQYPSYAAMNSGKPYVTTIHGMLDKWAVQNSKYKKKLAGILYENAALKKAACLQAFNMQEYEDIRGYGLKNPVCLVPNGVDLPANTAELKGQEPVWQGKVEEGKKVMLYLGRIHPKKGLTNLLKAWKKAALAKPAQMAEWVLAVAGWDQGGYQQELEQLAAELSLENAVYFLGPQFGEAKQLVFAKSNAFILPSFSEGLPMAVLEAWSYGLPALITKHCNLPEGIAAGAALPIDPEEKSITEGLVHLTSLNEVALGEMGEKGYGLVKEKFDWQAVAKQMHQVYQWISNNGPMPANILLK